MKIPLPAGSFKHISQPTNNQICRNYFPTSVGNKGEGAVTLLPTPGNKLLNNEGVGVVRLIKRINNSIYTVIGNKFYRCNINAVLLTCTLEELGTLLTDVGTVHVSYNNNQVILLDGQYGYIYNYVFSGTVAIGIVGGTPGDTYTLTINGKTIYSAVAVTAAILPDVLATTINTHTSVTNVVAQNLYGLFTLTAVAGATSIAVVESGTGFTVGVDGITVSPGVFENTLVFTQFQQITDSDFMGGSHVINIDNYFIYNEANTNRFWFSQPSEGRIWNGLDAASTNSKPGNVVALASSKGMLWVFCVESTEVWYDNANPIGSPFSKLAGADIDIGCGAKHSVVNINDLIVWLDNRGFIVQTTVSALVRDQSTGYKITKISDEPLDTELSTYTRLDDAIGTTYICNGHIMLEYTFPVAKKTWVFDYTTNVWIERTSENIRTGAQEHTLSQYSDSYKNLTVVGGIRDNKLYIMSTDYYKDNDAVITREFTTAYLTADFNPIVVNSLELKVATGLSETEEEANVMMSYSHNNGHNWSNEMMRPMGRKGNYNQRVVWHRLGNSHQWQWKFKITAAIEHSIIDLSANILVGQQNVSN